jgi:hypothetical protein
MLGHTFNPLLGPDRPFHLYPQTLDSALNVTCSKKAKKSFVSFVSGFHSPHFIHFLATGTVATGHGPTRVETRAEYSTLG